MRTAQGALVPATEVPMMRVRETWVHAVDLAGPVTFADIPAGVAALLIGSITDGWRGRPEVSGITFASRLSLSDVIAIENPPGVRFN